MTDDPSIKPIVVVGSSAGGIEALSVFLDSLPSSIPAPIVVVQHLDPKRRSRLAEILTKHTALPVRVVEGPTRLVDGEVLILPPDRQAELHGDEIILVEGGDPRPSPSIDAMLAAAAREYGEGAIAVILSGTGTDGALGARDIKAAGGTVIVQNPATASFSGMPASVAPSSVDIVAELPAIGPLLLDLVTGASAPRRSDDERVMRLFLEQLREHSGIDFSTYKRATITRRLQRRMLATGTSSLREYVRYVQANPDELQRVTSSFLIKVTEFFRDADLFDYLRDHVLPAAIETARANGNELRIWSAGCATGEEPYSLAILVAELLGDELDRFTVRIFATDVDSEAITFARRGRYPGTAVATIPRDLLDKYFSEDGDHYEVRKRIRLLTVFGQHDLGQRAPFPRVDVTLCRNVLIYFTTELQRRALQLFAFSLREGGFLVLGKAETTSPLPEQFVLEEPRVKVYRRHGQRVLIPPARVDAQSIASYRAATTRDTAGVGIPPTSAREVVRASGHGDRAETLLLQLPVGVILVDRRYDISTINANARRLLGIHGAAVGEDLVHLLPDDIAGEVRAQLDASFANDSRSAIYEIALANVEGEDVRAIQFNTSPFPSESSDEPSTVLVLVSDLTGTVQSRKKLEDSLAASDAERERVLVQARAMAAENARLLAANQDLTSGNANLRSANEELLVANEEVQAATEEVETLNEELQATNEELETLNEELQATVEELNTTNDDLISRSSELEETATALEAVRLRVDDERSRLQSIVDRLPEPVVAVDNKGNIATANAAFRSLAPKGPDTLRDEKGRPFKENETPFERAGRGEAFTARVIAADERLYEAASLPMDSGSETVSLVVFRPVAD